MKITIEINTDNAAFEDSSKTEETGRIVATIASKIQCGLDSGNCKDINGNTVGQWELIDD